MMYLLWARSTGYSSDAREVYWDPEYTKELTQSGGYWPYAETDSSTHHDSGIVTTTKVPSGEGLSGLFTSVQWVCGMDCVKIVSNSSQNSLQVLDYSGVVLYSITHGFDPRCKDWKPLFVRNMFVADWMK